MIRRLALLVGIAGLALASASVAGEPGLKRPDFLPPDALISVVLDAAPSVLEAEAMLSSSKAEANLLRAGDYETTTLASIDNRRIRGEGGVSEWSLQLSRPIRLPGKAWLDRKAGAAGVSAAMNSVEDARHQTSLTLVRLWVQWLEAEERRTIDQRELDTYRRDVSALERRVELKDASRLELEVMKAAAARAQASVDASSGAAMAARVDLESAFPGLAPERPPILNEPTSPQRAFELWPELIVSRSHEITIVRDLADREDLLARRAQMDRTPDPTLGVRTFNERGGAETGVGVFVSVPFGGPRRSALAQKQIALASAARVRLQRMEREVRGVAQRDVVAARSDLASWAAVREAAAQTAAATAHLRRAYDLGERDLSDLLLGERQLFEAKRNELAARAAAQMSSLKLALDAHELWLADE